LVGSLVGSLVIGHLTFISWSFEEDVFGLGSLQCACRVQRPASK
jgi:hypothetical protein